MLDILKNIPIPPNVVKPSVFSDELRKMDIGDAVDIPASKRAMASHIYDMKFTSRSIKNGMIRLWRIE